MNLQLKTLTDADLAAMKARGASKPKTRKAMSTKPKPAREEGLLNAADCLARIFPQASSRPTERWLQKRAQAGAIKHYKNSGFLFFKESEVRAAFATNKDELTTAQSARMSLAELWSEHGRVLTVHGQTAASAFFRRHIKNHDQN